MLFEYLRIFTQMACCLFAGQLALPEQLHHLRMFDTLSRFQPMSVLFKEISGHIEGSALVPVYKSVVAGNAFGITRCKLKCIGFTIGVLVLRSRKG